MTVKSISLCPTDPSFSSSVHICAIHPVVVVHPASGCGPVLLQCLTAVTRVSQETSRGSKPVTGVSKSEFSLLVLFVLFNTNGVCLLEYTMNGIPCGCFFVVCFSKLSSIHCMCSVYVRTPQTRSFHKFFYKTT